MTTVLVTGSAATVDPVAVELRAAGATVLVADPADPATVLDGVAPGTLDCYVQLPVVLEPEGETVVGRVRHFLEAGLLTRFRLVEAVLPTLATPGRVVLVGGHTLLDAATPDDRAARRAFLDVLAHAVRADRASSDTAVRVVDRDRPPAEIAALALAADAGSRRPVHYLEARAAEISYQDWRTEVLGITQVYA